MNDFQQQLMMMMAGQRPGFGQAQGLGADPFDIMPAAQVTSAPGQLAQLNRLISGLSGGQLALPSALTQNFHLHPQTNGSALMQSLISQNTRSFGNIGAMAALAQRQRVASLAGQGSVLRGLLGDGLANSIERGVMGTGSGMENVVGGMAAPMINQLLTQLTGYDVGSSANLVNARSMNMVSGMRALRGGFRVGASIADVLGKDFENERNMAGTLAFSGAQRLAWNIDDQGRIRGRNRNANGASESLVANILTRAIETGAIDEGFRDLSGDNLAAYNKIVEGLPPEMRERLQGRAPRFSDVSELQTGLFRQQDEKTNRIKALNRNRDTLRARLGDLKSAGVSEDNDKYKAVQDQISKIDTQTGQLNAELRAVSSQLGALGGVMATAGNDLVKSVTATVDSLKDLYGDETKAAQALAQMTNGEGLTNKTLAKQIKRAADEYKLTALTAGVDPAKAGEYLSRNLQNMGAQWGTNRITGSTAMGQLALDMSTMAMRGAAGISNPAEKKRYLDAESEMAADVGQSEGFRAKSMLEYARQEGMFGGREDLLKQIDTLMKSTDSRDFQKAKRLIQTVLGNGSLSAGQKLFNSPQAMAEIMSRLSPERSADVSRWATSKNADEIRRVQGREIRRQEEGDAATNLGRAGYSQTEINDIFQGADTQAIDEVLDAEIAAADKAGDTARAQELRDLKAKRESVKRSTLTRNGGDTKAAQRAADMAVMKDVRLGDATRQKIGETSTKRRIEAAKGKFGNADRILGEGNAALRDIMLSAGAASKDDRGEVSITGETMSIAANKLFDALPNYGVSAEDASNIRKQFNDLVKAGRHDEAFDLLNNTVKGFNDSTRRNLGADISDVYETPESRRAAAENGALSSQDLKEIDRIRKERGDLVGRLGGTGLVDENGALNKEALEKLDRSIGERSGMYGAAAEKRYRELDAKYGKDAQERHKLLGQNAEKRDERIKALTDKKGGEGLSSEEEAELARLEAEQKEYGELSENLNGEKTAAERNELSTLRGNLYGQGKEQAEARNQYAKDVATRRDAMLLSGADTRLKAYEDKRNGGLTDISEILSAVNTADQLAIGKDSGFTLAMHNKLRNGEALTKDEQKALDDFIGQKESEGASTQEGFGQKIVDFLTGAKKFDEALTNSSEQLEEFRNWISKVLEAGGFDIEHTDKAKGGAGEPPKTDTSVKPAEKTDEDKGAGSSTALAEQQVDATRELTEAVRENTAAYKESEANSKVSVS